MELIGCGEKKQDAKNNALGEVRHISVCRSECRSECRSVSQSVSQSVSVSVSVPMFV